MLHHNRMAHMGNTHQVGNEKDWQASWKSELENYPVLGLALGGMELVLQQEAG